MPIASAVLLVMSLAPWPGKALSRSANGGAQNVLEQRSGLPQLPVKASGGVVS
ncbi:hypothetical protein [Synechococcus sp. ROS8604]|uniref:hypothetical protein n=1 Tax=Synechococcus sp. ROS8604 TaxID=1442557 RepID=UPI001860EA2A|nr:hypothetical protein [Synechococcus sp. ROS8604]QNI86994.1 hypothetical protein SynROS8604_00324 [Synechococcus sp. ROS8604]